MYNVNFKAINNVCLYRSFVSIIRVSRNIKQKSTQQLIQTN